MSLIVKKAVAVPNPKKKAKYSWESFDSGYRIIFQNSDFAEIQPIDDKWEIKTQLNGDSFTGTRPTLEVAFKTVDRMLWVKKPDIWNQIDCRAVFKQFEGDLREPEFTYNHYEKINNEITIHDNPPEFSDYSGL
jgi:hypothetical protein